MSHPPIYVFDEHNEAFYYWHKAKSDGILGEPLDLFHLDAHDDMNRTEEFQKSVYGPVKPGEDSCLDYYADFVKTELDIANFIWPAVLTKIARNVYFVFPEWRRTKSIKRRMNISSAFGEGKIIKYNLEVDETTDPRFRKGYPDLTVFFYSQQKVENIPKNRRAILDIDFDYFACRDSVQNQFSYELETTENQFLQKEAFLGQKSLRFSGLEFQFSKKDGRHFVQVGPQKVKENVHLPEKEEIRAAVRNTFNVLRARRVRPAVITLCRSCLSGYCPADYTDFIESELRAALRDWLG